MSNHKFSLIEVALTVTLIAIIAICCYFEFGGGK